MMLPNDALVGLSEIATELHVTRSTVKAWNLKGLLPPVRGRVSGNPGYLLGEVRAWHRGYVAADPRRAARPTRRAS